MISDYNYIQQIIRSISSVMDKIADGPGYGIYVRRYPEDRISCHSKDLIKYFSYINNSEINVVYVLTYDTSYDGSHYNVRLYRAFVDKQGIVERFHYAVNESDGIITIKQSDMIGCDEDDMKISLCNVFTGNRLDIEIPFISNKPKSFIETVNEMLKPDENGKTHFYLDDLVRIRFRKDDVKYAEILMNGINENGRFVKCKDCGRMTYFTHEHMGWYKRKGLEVPKRCEYCIHERKMHKRG